MYWVWLKGDTAGVVIEIILYRGILKVYVEGVAWRYSGPT